MILSNKKGFGLIELMISILVASIIVAGLYQMLTSSMLNFGISSATGRSGKSARQVDNLVNKPAVIHTKSSKTTQQYPLFTSTQSYKTYFNVKKDSYQDSM